MNTKSCPDLNNNGSMNIRKAAKTPPNYALNNPSQTFFNRDKNSDMTKLNFRKERLNCSLVTGRTAAQSSVIETHMQECVLENCEFCKMIYSQKQDQTNIYFEEGPNSTLIFKKPLSPCSAVKRPVENRSQEDTSYEICEMMFTVEEESDNFMSFEDGLGSPLQSENATCSKDFVEQQTGDDTSEPPNSSANSDETIQDDDFKDQSKESQTIFAQGSKEQELPDSSSFDSCNKDEAVQNFNAESDVSNHSEENEPILDETLEDHPNLIPVDFLPSTSNSGEIVRRAILKDNISAHVKENASSQTHGGVFSQNESSKEHVELTNPKSFNSTVTNEDTALKDDIPNQSKESVCIKVGMPSTPDEHSQEHLKFHNAKSVSSSSSSNEVVQDGNLEDKISNLSSMNAGCVEDGMACSEEIYSKAHLKHLLAAPVDLPPQSCETVQSNYFKDNINDQSTLNVDCEEDEMASDEEIDSKKHLKHLLASMNLPPQSNETLRGNYFKGNMNDQSTTNACCEQDELVSDEEVDSKEHLKHLLAAAIPHQSDEAVQGNYFKANSRGQSEGSARFRPAHTRIEDSGGCHQRYNADSFCLPSTSNQTVRPNDFTDNMSNQSIRNANCQMGEIAHVKSETSYEHPKLPPSGSFHLPSSNEVILGNNFEEALVDQSIEAHEMCEVIFREGENAEKPKSILFAGALPPSVYKERKSVNNGLSVNPLPYCEEMPRCGICGKIFFSDNELKSHFGVHYRKEAYSSAIKKVIPLNRILVNHPRVSSESSASSGGDSKMQEKSQSKQTSYLCFHCHRAFVDFKDMNEHVKYHRRKQPYACKYCSKVFKLVSELEIHEKIHVIDQRYSCYYCEKKFARHRELKEHLLVHTGKKAFVCKYCNKEYLFLSHLKIHMNVHVKDRLMTCEFCGLKFHIRTEFREHLKSHKIKPYACDYCDKKFGEAINLKTHMRIHTGRVIYSCMYCKKDFGFISQLKIHERTHTREKKYSCHMCEEAFSRHNELKDHLLSHTEFS